MALAFLITSALFISPTILLTFVTSERNGVLSKRWHAAALTFVFANPPDRKNPLVRAVPHSHFLLPARHFANV